MSDDKIIPLPTDLKFKVKLSEKEYTDTGVLDVNLKLRVKVGVNADMIAAYGTHRTVICAAETASDLEHLLEEFIRIKMAEDNLFMEKICIV